MVKYYIMIVSAAFLIAIQFLLGKLYEKKAGNGLACTLRFGVINGIVCGLLFFGLNGFKINTTAFSVFMSLAMSVLFTAIGICNVVVIAKGETSVYSIFSMLGLMSLPFLFGIIFLKENASACKIIGCLLLVISLIVPVCGNKSKRKGEKSFILWCVLVFLLNGVVAIVSKIHQINPQAASTYDFISVMYFFSAAISVLLYAGVFAYGKIKGGRGEQSEQAEQTKQTAEKAKENRKNLCMALGVNFAYAVVSGVGYLLQLFGAVKLDASVLYPIVTGGTVVLSTLFAWVVYKEKPTLPITLGITLTAVATVLFAF